jgi:hypothetical protein
MQALLVNKKRMSRGYFFTLDAFIAAGVILVGILIVLSFNPGTPETAQLSIFAYDVIETFTNTKVSEYDNNYVRQLLQSGEIANEHNTLLEQVGEFYYVGRSDLMSNYLHNLTRYLIPPEYGIGFYIDGAVQFERGGSVGGSTQVVSAKLSSVGVYNSTTLWGPYMLEVRIWQ